MILNPIGYKNSLSVAFLTENRHGGVVYCMVYYASTVVIWYDASFFITLRFPLGPLSFTFRQCVVFHEEREKDACIASISKKKTCLHVPPSNV